MKNGAGKHKWLEILLKIGDKMSHIVKEPTYIIGYNLNSNAVGMFEYKRSNDKSKMEKEIKILNKMIAKKKAEIFECTEIQAENMRINLISIFPSKGIVVDETENDKKNEQEEFVLDEV